MVNFLLCFSVIKNAKAILNTDVPKGAITSINGMRTLSITWVVLAHTMELALKFTGTYQTLKIGAIKIFFIENLFS